MSELTIEPSTGTTGPRRFRRTKRSKSILAHRQAHRLRDQAMSMRIRLQAMPLIRVTSFHLLEGSCFGMPPEHTVCHLPSSAIISAEVSSHLCAANGNYAASIKRALSGAVAGLPPKRTSQSKDEFTLVSNEGGNSEMMTLASPASKIAPAKRVSDVISSRKRALA